MPTLPSLDRTALLLAGIGAAAGVALAVTGVLSAPAPAAMTVPPPVPAAVTLPNPPAAQAEASPGEAVRRPLFAESRRPPVPKPVVVAPVTVPAPDLQVTGIIAGSNSGVATGTDKRTQKPFRLRTGETLGDWQVEAITRTSLRLRHDAQSQEYPLVTPPPLTPSPRPQASGPQAVSAPPPPSSPPPAPR